MNEIIPKTIHYCWFGGNPLPELAQKCIASWKKHCPGYEILEWNESNFDVTCCDYVHEAYEAKKWAFVSDYARLKILYEQGGLYFDTDVELIKPLDDIISKGGFMGREEDLSQAATPNLCLGVTSSLGLGVNPGLGLGVSPGLSLCKELLEAYHSKHFVNKDGSYNLKTIVDYTTEILFKHGLNNTNEIQFVAGVYVYPKEYFCPIDYITGELSITKNTYSIHHYSASWHSEKENYAVVLQRKLSKKLPKRISSIVGTLVSIAKYDGVKACFKWVVKRSMFHLKSG